MQTSKENAAHEHPSARLYDRAPLPPSAHTGLSGVSDPALKSRWFGAPGSWTEKEWSLDFRVGGGELSAGRDDDGHHHLFRSRYHDIVEGDRIVFAYDLLLDHRLVSVSLTTIQLQPGEDGGGTHLIFTEHGAFFDELEDPAEREHGTRLLLDGLGTFLAGTEVSA